MTFCSKATVQPEGAGEQASNRESEEVGELINARARKLVERKWEQATRTKRGEGINARVGTMANREHNRLTWEWRGREKGRKGQVGGSGWERERATKTGATKRREGMEWNETGKLCTFCQGWLILYIFLLLYDDWYIWTSSHRYLQMLISQTCSCLRLF